MAKQGESSFRRILLTRILLLSVPVLLLGEMMVFQKTRASLLGTARQNLTESAIRKGQSIEDAIAALKSNLLSASQTAVLQTGTPQQAQQFLNLLAPQLPTTINCLHLTNIQTWQTIASTCGDASLLDKYLPDNLPGFLTRERFTGDNIHVVALLHPNLPASHTKGQLQLLFSAPVYDQAGNLRYILSLHSALEQQRKNQPKSLTGSTIIISQDGTILAHPRTERVGSNIYQQPDAQRLESIVKNAIAGRENFLHLSFNKNGKELVAGYTAIDNPIPTAPKQKWVILAVTDLDNALFGLKQIKLVLLVLTIGLIGGSCIASFYLARDLALPLERLRDYTLNLHNHHTAQPVPHNFNIREFNQLAQAQAQMLERLKDWAEEIETAWQEAQAANKLKSEFLATTSHELRTPLNAMIGCVRLVRDGYCDSPEEEKDFLNRADDAAIHLLGIINDLLDIAKIEAGKLSVVSELINLRQVLQEVIDLQSVSIQQKGLQLNFTELLEDIPVEADPAKLKQVLINVIGNAVKFTETGSITLNTKIVAAENTVNGNAKHQVVITVQDTGVGVDPTQQQKLFRPFVMVDGTTTRRFGGTGLGLAISRNLMELMGGSIHLYSAGRNQGTTVTIALPVVDAYLLRAKEKVAAQDLS